ncbi:Uncharacterised protein [Salmonella enterica subsp. enterica serovar Bovismorbificans]|uniref:Uncharacterized protein n=1 Tax=Salmonella enterica subsp. enterica serovar Bovismorbificans TaxID=58097 RepID=A0A655E1B1_SALET|nr:Uncharacterised protein [Salmonella enterica subsp. enterica serovar Bovismorbificans]CNU18295.1 Uncharacterised protein [Salmonella enterica subsp. enterica serovar Bovismorbificans]CNU77494.1 Uncharacterised protein [Salmonella enterica subsp. enterica serovar Bovismorbificans]CNU98366.1 Uncharacterised protein [Salmonella enterica subsp. enterica serovar Bovismorbificans]CPR43551.1 Uncharacterised protein [Salmonella enterica subsp. enterica serovar Bovismorbificans]
MIGKHINTLRRRPRPVDHQRYLQMTLRPVEAIFFRRQRYAASCGNDHDSIVEFTGLSQRVQNPIDLRIHVAGGTGVTLNKIFLVTVINVSTVKRYP